MGCIISHPIRTTTDLQSLALQNILRLKSRLTSIFSWLKERLPPRPVKTYATLSEPGPHIPVEVPPVAKFLCEDQIDRYDWAYAEMSLSKRERMRRQSALVEPPMLSGADSSMAAVDVDSGARGDLSGDPFLFL